MQTQREPETGTFTDAQSARLAAFRTKVLTGKLKPVNPRQEFYRWLYQTGRLQS